MKIFVECFWGQNNKNYKKFFNFKECLSLIEEYNKRLTERGFQTQVVAGSLQRRPRSLLLLCHPRGKEFDSIQISNNFQRAMSSGLDLVVAVGGDHGFSKDDISKLKPDLIWSYGPLTLPHELATVVATEQLYRAASILRHEPYHRP